MNYWFWLYLTLIPIIVLSVKPSAPHYYRLGRLIFAIATCYLLMNSALHKGHEIFADAVNANPHSTWRDFDRVAAACGASDAFLIVFGWFWSINYVGWWELIWRLINARSTSDKRAYHYSNIIILLTLIITLWAFSHDRPIHALRMLLPSLNTHY